MGPMPVDGGSSGGAAEPLAQLAPLENRASQSKSPYVKSHFESSVAWQLLDQATIDRAKKENKLIFLHIGYKACHCESTRLALQLG